MPRAKKKYFPRYREGSHYVVTQVYRRRKRGNPILEVMGPMTYPQALALQKEMFAEYRAWQPSALEKIGIYISEIGQPLTSSQLRSLGR